MKLAAWFLAAVVALGAAPAAAAFAPQDWRYRREVRLPPPNPKRYYYLRVDPEVFHFANPDLSDLRLVNRRGLEVPYVLETRNEEPRWERYLPRVWVEKDEILLDLGRDGLAHNQVLLLTPSANFRGRAAVFTRDDAGEWLPLAHDLAVFDHTTREVHAANLRLNYPETTSRYLRIVLSLDQGEISDPGAEVMMVRTIFAEYQDLADVGFTCEPDPKDNDSVCRLALNNLPVSRISIGAADDGFFRNARLVDRQGKEYAAGCLYRYPDRELVRQNLELTLPEVQVGELILRIRNFDDQPLAISSIRAATTARDLVFRAGPDDGLRLYLGNRAARPPVYDLSLLMDRVRPEPRPVWVDLGPVEPNTDFAPPAPAPAPPEPFFDPSEYSDLLWPGLVFTAFILAGLILASVRQIRRDADTKPPGNGVN